MEAIAYIVAVPIGIVVLYTIIRTAVWSALRSHAKDQAKLQTK